MSKASIEQLIRQQVNPFDPNTFKPGNFWQDPHDSALDVTSIHQDVLDAICATLAAVSQDGATRTILLTGESGAGKSHLLGRLKRLLNNQAFFVYIGPWPDSHFIWRHLLRNAVDSLMEVPEGKQESQLLLWLQGLLKLQSEDFAQRVFGKRRSFIRNLCTLYPTGIYNPNEFFGALYDLTNPDLAFLACSWLRGDNLDEESCAELRVRCPIDSEDAAQKILGNFGKISAATQPIVLCFDNLDNLPHLPNGNPDFQSLFNVNSSIHNEKLHNFLLLLSIVTNTWKQNCPFVQPADLSRISQELQLKSITLEEAETLWANRLYPLHRQAEPSPHSPLEPLHRDWLEQEFPSGKTLPRNALVLGQRLIDRFKHRGKLPAPQPQVLHPTPTSLGTAADFELVWHNEFQKVQQQITRIAQLPAPDLIWRLQEVLDVLKVPDVKIPFLEGTKFAAYSLCYRERGLTGVVWTEDPNMSVFFYIMKACEKMIEKQSCDRLYLLRAASLGRSSSKGNKLFHQIFAFTNYLHIQPDLASVHYLETYHNLVNAACGRELVVGQHIPDLTQLQGMMRSSGILQHCQLLQELDRVEAPRLPLISEDLSGEGLSNEDLSGQGLSGEDSSSQGLSEVKGASPALAQSLNSLSNTQAAVTLQADAEALLSQAKQAKQYLLNLITTQKLLGMQVLVEQGHSQFPKVSERRLIKLVEELCQEGRIQTLNPDADPNDQLVCCMIAEQ